MPIFGSKDRDEENNKLLSKMDSEPFGMRDTRSKEEKKRQLELQRAFREKQKAKEQEAASEEKAPVFKAKEPSLGITDQREKMEPAAPKPGKLELEKVPTDVAVSSEESKLLDKQLKTALKELESAKSALAGQPAQDVASLIKEAKATQKDDRKRLALLEFAQTLAHSLAQIGAAQGGAGKYATQMQFDKSGWDRLYGNVRQDYQDAISQIEQAESQRGEAEKGVAAKLKDVMELRKMIAAARDKEQQTKARLAEGVKDRNLRRELQDDAQQARETIKSMEADAKKALKDAKESGPVADKGVPMAIQQLTDDEAAQKELFTAAALGDKEFAEALKRASVADKLNPKAVKSLMKPSGFLGFGDPEIDVEELYTSIIEDKRLQIPEDAAEKKQETMAVEDKSPRFKHSATGPGGKKIYSVDGVNWVDAEGDPVK